jgi:hypothetical protein
MIKTRDGSAGYYHSFENGEQVTITGMEGFTALNSETYIVDKSDYTRVVITDITSANPAVVTTDIAHGLTAGDIITIRDVIGMDCVNTVGRGRAHELITFTVGSAGLTATSFQLKSSDGKSTD